MFGKSSSAPNLSLGNPYPRPSMRAAINAKCKDCIYDPLSNMGTWVAQTENCPSTNCPLYPLRPVRREYKKARKSALEGHKQTGDSLPAT